MNNKVKFLRGTSNEYAVAEKDSDTIYFTTDDGKLYIGDKEVSGSDIIIDDTLSDTSTNPVQNKVVKQAIDNKADKTVATTDTDGLMSASDKAKLDNANDTYALKSKYGDTTIDVGRKVNSDVGICSTAEGSSTTASGLCSHAEGDRTTASGSFSHSEGELTKAIEEYSHAEGCVTEANGSASHAEGRNTTASGYASHAEGSNAYISNGEIAFYDTRAVTISDDVTVEVDSSKAYGANSHAEGCQTLAYGDHSHAEGTRTTASSNGSHAEGSSTIASGVQSHAEGVSTVASGSRSHAEGILTTASGAFCHAEGKETTANGNNSCHAEGALTTANGIASHAEGNSNNKATDLIPDLSWQTTTDEEIINAWNTQQFSLAHGGASHVEGSNNLALGHASHAEGNYTVAVGNNSHTSGYFTKALHNYEAAYGKYNESNEDTLFSIGDGTADDARHNAFEITTTGGKLHDKDIATLDDIPATLPADGGNADTVNNKKVELSTYTNLSSFGCNGADTADTIYQAIPQGSIYVDMMQNLTDTSWDFPSGVSNEYTICIIKISKHRIGGIYLYPKTGGDIYCGFISQEGVFIGNWKKISDDGQGYIVGTTTIDANSLVCTTDHGFTPSAVLYQINTNSVNFSQNFGDTYFIVDNGASVDRTVAYIILK